MAGDAPQLVENFFRHEYGRTVSGLVRRYGPARIELIEDCVQSAMARALTTWGMRGIPDNPGAWLAQVARNSMLDRLRHAQVEAKAEPELGRAQQSDPPPASLGEEIPDDELRMLFVCCDEALPPRTQLVLALKILCGFSVKEIALRLFTEEEAARKRIQRGRAQFRAISPELLSPSRQELQTRLPAVHQVLYLLFNEGYSSARPDEPIRRQLCEEALRLIALVCAHPIANRQSWALRALMVFHHARIDARTDSAGGLLFLDEQDRNQWNRGAIYQGMRYLMQAGNEQPLSRYHVEAAILLEHLSAPSYEETNWEDIYRMYGALNRVAPSPLHLIGRAIALTEWKGAEAGIKELRSASPPTWLARYYLWDATLGELYRRAGKFRQARTHLGKAVAGAPTDAERTRIQERLERCESAAP